MHEALTVHETLYYAAMLRLPRHMSHEDKLRRVDVVTTALGLHTCQDTIIGEGGLWGGFGGRSSLQALRVGQNGAACSAWPVELAMQAFSIWLAHKCIWVASFLLVATAHLLSHPAIPALRRRLLPQGRQWW